MPHNGRGTRTFGSPSSSLYLAWSWGAGSFPPHSRRHGLWKEVASRHLVPARSCHLALKHLPWDGDGAQEVVLTAGPFPLTPIPRPASPILTYISYIYIFIYIIVIY